MILDTYNINNTWSKNKKVVAMRLMFGLAKFFSHYKMEGEKIVPRPWAFDACPSEVYYSLQSAILQYRVNREQNME